MSDIKNEQEEFWAGDFGDQYIDRNKSDKLLAANLKMFARIFSNTQAMNSIAEYGCNVGMNLKAIRKLLPTCKLRGVEINQSAVDILKKNQPYVDVSQKSILDKDSHKVDLTFTKGVLIHIHPENLDKIYNNLYCNSDQYILVAEYYNPNPVTLSYRGFENKLFKRDFAGDLLDRYSDLKLVDYGFFYHRDKFFPQDDISWFLLSKTK